MWRRGRGDPSVHPAQSAACRPGWLRCGHGWAPGSPTPVFLLPQACGPSVARRRPAVGPRARYQIINKAAGAVRVNILAAAQGTVGEGAAHQGHPHLGGGCGLRQPPLLRRLSVEG